MNHAQADPPTIRGKPTPQVHLSEIQPGVARGIDGRMCASGKQAQLGRDNHLSRSDDIHLGRWGGGEARSTAEVG